MWKYIPLFGAADCYPERSLPFKRACQSARLTIPLSLSTQSRGVRLGKYSVKLKSCLGLSVCRPCQRQDVYSGVVCPSLCHYKYIWALCWHLHSALQEGAGFRSGISSAMRSSLLRLIITTRFSRGCTLGGSLVTNRPMCLKCQQQTAVPQTESPPPLCWVCGIYLRHRHRHPPKAGSSLAFIVIWMQILGTFAGK